MSVGDRDPVAQHPLGAIEVAQGPIDDSEFDPVEWDAASTGSVSLTSNIYSHQFELGRRYHSYRHGRYPLPNDEEEIDREDLKHAMMLELTDGNLFYSPMGENPQKIIDVGTGTAADEFPSAEVLGIDLSPMQPIWVPPNVRFLVDDAEDEWLHGGGFDFVHLRYMISFLKNIDKFIGQAYNHMKPGAWIEFQELHMYPHCDDDTATAGGKCQLTEFFDIVVSSFLLFGADFHKARDFRHHLEGAGFKEIRCKVKKVPIGTWAQDRILRLCGLYLKNAIKDVLPAFHKPFEANGLSPAETEVWNAIARKEIEDNSKHRYFNFYFWYAQKP